MSEICSPHRTAGRIAFVEEESPAWEVGFEPGCYIFSADGHPLRDVIDWRWWASGPEVLVEYRDCDGDEGSVLLERESGQDWGISFEKVVFDEVIQCRNACTFCFMRQLPDDVRASLTLRDDDYRLSFLQGTFVTFTNITPEDEARIIEQHISPLRYSLHAATPEVRRAIIGKHAQHGIEVAERLMSCGIELHAQIVLMPGENDGEELVHTLNWAWQFPQMRSVGIVPLGYTKHQKRFQKSFGRRESAQGVIAAIEPFQRRAMEERSHAWVFASDEFYRNAFPDDLIDHVPPASFYGEFDLFEDGIGIIRSTIDEWRSQQEAQVATARAFKQADVRLGLVAGYAQREFLSSLIDESPLRNWLVPLYVKNEYFGGNVDVTGLLCGCDVGPAIAKAVACAKQAGVKPISAALLPSIVLNADGVMLDESTPQMVEQAAGIPVHVVSCQSSKYLLEIQEILQSV